MRELRRWLGTAMIGGSDTRRREYVGEFGTSYGGRRRRKRRRRRGVERRGRRRDSTRRRTIIGCRRRRRRCRVEEDGGGVAGDGKWFTSSKGTKGGASETERPTIVRVRGGEVVARVDSLLHKAAPLLAPPHSVLVVELRRRATHLTSPEL